MNGLQPSEAHPHIAVVSKADAIGGGASAVATILASRLRAHAFPTLHYCLYAAGGFDYERRPIGGHSSRLFMDENLSLKAHESLAEVIPLEAAFFEDELARFPISLFHFHDLTSAVSPLTLDRLASRVPVVWTLHDFSPFTGGCIYPMGCDRWLSTPGCLTCPQHGQWPLDTAADTAWINREIRQRVHTNKNIHLVSPSRWLAEQAARSGIVDKHITIIPNGIPPEPFQVTSKAAARAKLGLSADDFVLLLSSGHLSDKRKNVIDSIEAAKNINIKNKKLIILGNKDSDIEASLDELDVVMPGFINDRYQLAEYLAASDVFLFTSLAENHPLSTLEAMAAGSCVVGYATGGVSEQLSHAVNALLVPPGDRDALLSLARQITSREALFTLGRRAREVFGKKFTDQIMVKNYIDFFQSHIRQMT
jgi:glycosyltransferase involved in cell wall biosynthesis